MADRPTITTFGAGSRYDTSTLNTNFTALRDAFDTIFGINGTSGSNNTLTGDLDMDGNDIRNVGSISISGGSTLAEIVGYAEEWANKAEDSLVSTAAGGDGATEYSSLHWAAKAAADVILTNADVVSTNADVVLTNADVVTTNADVVTTNADVVLADAAAAAAAASAAGIYWKAPVLNATTANITLSGEQTIDGVLTSTSRILVKDQTAPEENGIYVTAAGAWSRAAPMDTWDEHVAAAVAVSEGTAGADTLYLCTSDAGGTLETTAITWVQFGAGGMTAASVDTMTNKTFDANGTGNRLSNVDVADLANGTAGELITWGAAGGPSVVAAGTATHVLTSNGVGVEPTFQAPAASGPTLGTSVATTSGTSIDFTGIPSGTTKITVSNIGLSTSGTSVPLFQIGDAGGVEVSGYLGTGDVNATRALYTTGAGLGGAWASANIVHGTITLTLENASTFTWAMVGLWGSSDAANTWQTAASKSLSAELDRIRLTTVGGSDTFDAGEMNITYE